MSKKQEWKNEPDFVKWIDPATGLRCAIIRNTFGALCGYVRVPLGKLRDSIVRKSRQPGWYKVRGKVSRRNGYDHSAVREMAVHGGITYCGKLRHVGVNRGIWLGFDCAHFGDLCPKLPLGLADDGEYRNLKYVRNECTRLANQVSSAAEFRKWGLKWPKSK